METVIQFACMLGYIIMIGISYGIYIIGLIPEDSPDEHVGVIFFLALFWPITLPFIISAVVTLYVIYKIRGEL